MQSGDDERERLMMCEWVWDEHAKCERCGVSVGYGFERDDGTWVCSDCATNVERAFIGLGETHVDDDLLNHYETTLNEYIKRSDLGGHVVNGLYVTRDGIRTNVYAHNAYIRAYIQRPNGTYTRAYVWGDDWVVDGQQPNARPNKTRWDGTCSERV